MTRQYRAAAGRTRNAAEKTADFWTRGAGGDGPGSRGSLVFAGGSAEQYAAYQPCGFRTTAS